MFLKDSLVVVSITSQLFVTVTKILPCLCSNITINYINYIFVQVIMSKTGGAEDTRDVPLLESSKININYRVQDKDGCK